MTNLPPGWATTTIGEIADTSLGKMLDRGKSSGRHLVPYLRNVNVQWGRIDTSDIFEIDIPPDQRDFYRLKRGDLLICEGGEIGRSAIWLHDGEYMAFQKALHRARPCNGVDARYIRHYMEHLHLSGSLSPYATGSTIKHMPQAELRRVRIALAPSSEQRRIVAALDDHLSRLDAAETDLEVIRRRVDHLSDQILLAACAGWRGEGTLGVTAKPPAAAGVIDRELPSVPPNWRWVRLGEIADVVGGVTKDSKKQSDPSVPEYPYLRVANVQRGRLDLTNVTTIRVTEAKAAQLRLQEGDVLLNEGGDRDKLGRGWIWEGQIGHCIHQNHVFRARIRDGILHPKLLAWHANGFGRHWCEANGSQSVNLASISLSKIKMLPVPVPPAMEQASLVETAETYLSLLARCELLIAQARASTTRLRRSLLSEAFEGRLVPQDPGDEPASVLLERIQRERAASPKPRRGRRTASVPQEEALL